MNLWIKVTVFILTVGIVFGTLGLNKAAAEDVAIGINVLPYSDSGFEGSETGEWRSTDTTRITLSEKQSYTGKGSMVVENRKTSSDGAVYDVLQYMKKDKYYKVSARVRLDNANTDTISLLARRIDNKDVAFHEYMDEVTVRDDRWVEMVGSFIIHSAEDAKSLEIVIRGAAPGVNFYIDDVVVQRYDWKKIADDRIERIRKSDALIKVVDKSGKPVSGANIEARQIRHEFGFGSTLNKVVLKNEKYSEFFKKYFEWATFENETKWIPIEKEQGKENYENADALYEFCKQNDIKVRGHTVFWEVGGQVPEWAKKLSDSELKKAMENRIQSVMTRYKGKFEHWDVNNEMIHGTYFQNRFGKSIFTWMYQMARELDPDVKLFVNDFDVIEANLTNKYINSIRELMDSGAPVNAVGIQGHFWNTKGRIDPVKVEHRINEIAKLNLPIWITEFDSPDFDEKRRADKLEKMYRTAFSNSNVEGIIMWGFWAGAHWGGPEAAMVEYDWTLNEAGKRYVSLMEEWTTKTSGTTDGRGEYSFRGFHGRYEVTVTLPGGYKEVKVLNLESGKKKTVEVYKLDKAVGGNFFKSIIEWFSSLIKKQ